LRDLPRLAEFPLRSFARFCTFDPFLRLAMFVPDLVGAPQIGSKDNRSSPGNLSNELSPDFSLSEHAVALFFLGRTGSSLPKWEDGDDGEGIRLASLPVRQPSAAVQENGTYEATRQSRWHCAADGFAVCGFSTTLARYLEIASDNELTTVAGRPRLPKFLHDCSSTSKARETPREPLFFCAICEQQGAQYKINKIKLSMSMIVVTPTTESTNASLASW
jgi:hypothetical protein